MNSDRIKEIQETTSYPDSISVKQALLQVWNECEQQQVKNFKHDALLVGGVKRSEQFNLKQLWIMAQKYNSCDFIKMVEEIERLNCH